MTFYKQLTRDISLRNGIGEVLGFGWHNFIKVGMNKTCQSP
jgi:hypothetical protein